MEFGTFLRARLEHTLNARRSPTEIKAIQQKKFRRLVAYAREHSPYYRDLMSACGIDPDSCQPTDFPPMTKADLMANFDRIATDRRVSASAVAAFLESSVDPKDHFLDKYVVLASTGTQGAVGHCVYSPAEWARGMALVLRTFPFALRRRRLASYGLMGGHEGGSSGAATGERSLARLRFDSRSFDVEDPFDKVIDQLNIFQPDILTGQPSALVELALAQEGGFLRIAPALLSLGGDSMPANDRALLDRAFGATISNHYGASELLVMGYGLSQDGGLHLFDDEFIFEIEDDRVLVTSLFKFTQPLIRYALDDRLEPLNDPNPRLPFTKIKDIAPRTPANATFSNGDGEDVQLAAETLLGITVTYVERLQLLVFDKLSCLVRVKLAFGLSDQQRSDALAQLEQRLTEIFRNAGIDNVSRRIEEVRGFAGRKRRPIVMPGMLDTMSDEWKRTHSFRQLA